MAKARNTTKPKAKLLLRDKEHVVALCYVDRIDDVGGNILGQAITAVTDPTKPLHDVQNVSNVVEGYLKRDQLFLKINHRAELVGIVQGGRILHPDRKTVLFHYMGNWRLAAAAAVLQLQSIRASLPAALAAETLWGGPKHRVQKK